MAQTDQLISCIESLFLGRAAHDANTFIQQYSEAKECWASALYVLSDTGRPLHVKYFCANILYNKVCAIIQDLTTVCGNTYLPLHRYVRTGPS